MGKTSRRTPRRKLKDNIEADLEETICEDTNWGELC
jgi:hypothetical protein